MARSELTVASVNAATEFFKNATFDFHLDGWQAAFTIVGLGFCVSATIVGSKIADLYFNGNNPVVEIA